MLLPLIIILVAFVPNFIWLFFYLQKDPHPEPPPFLLAAFLLGIIAVGVVFLFLEGVRLFFVEVLNVNKGVLLSFFLFFVFAAFLEEVIKFFMGRVLLWRNSVFDEPIDAMIYLVVIALGFAFAENLLYLRNFQDVYEIVGLAIGRFVSANFLHSVSSGIVGYFWAQGIVHHKVRTKIISGLFVAGIIHSLFNVLVFLFQSAYIINIPILFITFAGLFLLHDFEKLKRLSIPTTEVILKNQKTNPLFNKRQEGTHSN